MASGEGCCALRLSSQNISHRHRDYRELHAGPGCGAGGGQPPVQLGQVSGSFTPAVPRPSISPAASGARSHCTLSHKPSFSPCRLNRLEQALARSKPGKEGCHFQTNLVEAHVYSVSADSFKGLNLSSTTLSSPLQQHTGPNAMHCLHPAGCLGWVGCPLGLRWQPGVFRHSPQEPWLLQDEQNSSVLNNHILGAFLQNRAVTGLGQPVEIQFWHNLDASNATCVFWVPGAGKSGSWSREGCKTEHREGTVVCHCSHLTYFAVLMLSGGGGPVLESLTYISTVGCSISAAATFCTLLRRPKDTTTRIHMNLLAALFLLNGSFLLSKPLATGTKELCQAAAALLHGSLLCSLAWMGAEAFHLYLLLVKVYNIYIQHYLLKLCLCAWGLPTLVPLGYGHWSPSPHGCLSVRCWLTSKPAHFVTLCYAGLILLFNTLMLAAVVVMLRRIKSQKGQARRDWATVLGLTCLLGTTWGLAFFSFGVLLIPQLYLFTILNSLQGQWGAPGQGRRSGGGKPVGASLPSGSLSAVLECARHSRSQLHALVLRALLHLVAMSCAWFSASASDFGH
uniref:Adhesion G protein-coupled receptor G5 n=1 Tax=Anas platyrhynchos platyrhynchos TaxID=8840 RepID=A0A493SZR7_ANAPP